MDANKTSAPIRLLEIVWESTNSASPFSWERLNHSMMYTMTLAVGSGMTFKPGDFKIINLRFRPGRWLRWENMYSLAVAVGNRSAVEEFERHFERAPIIADNVKLNESGAGFTHGSPGRREKERLVLGAEFPWRGFNVRVTSFTETGVVACAYRKEGERKTCKTCQQITGWPKEKLAKKFTLTPDDIKKDRAERKAKAKEGRQE